MTSPTPDTEATVQAGTGVPLVLIVDDNVKNLKLARDVLRAAGLRTLDATTGGEGIELAAGQQPDVILLDLQLPDMDGLDVARALKSDRRTAGLPVVALSALQLDSDDERLHAAGFSGRLGKPISVGDFPDQVRSYCSDLRA